MPISIKYSDGKTITFDNYREATEQKQATVTSHTVETGSDISDNSHIEQNRLTITGLVTGTIQQPDVKPDPIAFLTELEDRFNKKQLITILTKNKIHKNYAIESYSIQEFNAFDFLIQLQAIQINTVLTATATIPASRYKSPAVADRNATKKDKGQGNKKDLSTQAAVKSSSVAAKFVKALQVF